MEPLAEPLSASQIMTAVEHLSVPELDAVASHVLALRAARRAPHVDGEETTLLQRISQTLPADLGMRLQTLVAQRDTAALTEAEYAELATLTDHLEVLHADRMEALATLAQRRGVTLDEVMRQLHIRFPDHG
jgi:hypothetical protein